MTKRDFDQETRDNSKRQYAYGFDYDVMQKYMLRSFEPFFRSGALLELGSFKGEFTKKLMPHFDDITCVEASKEACETLQQDLKSRVTVINETFENVKLDRKFQNIIMTHVLEHVDDPIKVLARIRNEWLEDEGYFFLCCPNAHAASRQIAVSMGVVSHCTAVTPAEFEHGHRCTYSFDTLERDVKLAGLRVAHRSGVFFKALANFQWDKILNSDVVSDAYLDGCFELGQRYPELCASIFLLCKKN